MDSTYTKIQESVRFLKEKHPEEWPRTAIVMGSGLSDIFSEAVIIQDIPYRTIPNFPLSTVMSHKGHIRLCVLDGHPVVILAGRWHYYEGYSSQEITFPIRVLKSLGVKNVLFTNVSGGVNPDYNTGDLVLLQDHINMIPDHPLRGPNDERLGLRFPDMLHTYSFEIQNTILKSSAALDIPIKKGVYLALQGPSLETPAEYKMAYRIGADMVGMSTVPEVIVAKHSDMGIGALSIISNVCYPPDRITETTMEEVVQVAKESGRKLAVLLTHVLARL